MKMTDRRRSLSDPSMNSLRTAVGIDARAAIAVGSRLAIRIESGPGIPVGIRPAARIEPAPVRLPQGSEEGPDPAGGAVEELLDEAPGLPGRIERESPDASGGSEGEDGGHGQDRQSAA